MYRRLHQGDTDASCSVYTSVCENDQEENREKEAKNQHRQDGCGAVEGRIERARHNHNGGVSRQAELAAQ